MAKNPPDKQTRTRARTLRWLYILLLGSIGAVEYALLGPKIGALAEQYGAKLFGSTGSFPLVASLLITFLALTFFHKKIKTRMSHLRHALKYPPLPIAIILACSVSSVIPQAQGGYFASIKPPLWFGVASAAGYLTLWLVYVVSHHFWVRFKTGPPDHNTAIKPNADSLDALSDAAFEEWIRREDPIERPLGDLFGHLAIAEKLLTRLQRGENTIALLGDFGCGKSTIAALTRDLASKDPKSPLIFVQTSCWGFEDASSAQRDVLVEILRKVAEHVDCLSIRNIPTEYLDAVSEHAGWFKSIVRVEGSQRTPLEQLQQMSPVLAAIGKRVVIFIEDVDRNLGSFDISRIQALLATFREVEGISFVLSISRAQGFDFARVCDHLETVPALEAKDTLIWLERLRNILLARYPPGVLLDRIEPLTDNDSDYSSLYHHIDYHWSWKLAISRLLTTPRMLKHALRRISEAWPRLKGEICVDHLICICVLRISSPEVFEFFARNHVYFPAAIQQPPNGLTNAAKIKFREDLQSEWQRITAEKQVDSRSLSWLLKEIDPSSSAVTGVSGTHSIVRQSMHSKKRRNVYARRLLTEGMEPNEIHDQTILKLLERVKSNPEALYELARLITDSTPGTAAFEDLGSGLEADKQLSLLSEIYAVMRDRHEQYATSDSSPGFLGPWRLINQSTRSESFNTWLSREIEKSIPGHLRLMKDIYYYWVGSNRHSKEERERPRRIMWESLKNSWGRIAPSEIAKGFDPTFPHTLFHIIFTSDFQQPDSVPYGRIDDWAWMRNVLLEASRNSPEIVLPQVIIVLQQRSDSRREWVEYNFDDTFLDCLFGEKTNEILKLIANGFEIDPRIDAQSAHLLKLAVERASQKLSS